MSWRRDFDAARDPYTARNALGIQSPAANAPVDAQYITAANDPTLTNDRVLTNTATITWDFSTAGQAKASATGGGNVSNSGTPTIGQYGKWVTATTIQGAAPATVLSDIGAQPLDATLTALAAYNTNGLLTQTAADTFTGRTLIGPATGITVTNGSGVAGNPTLALANDLAALEALAGTNTLYYRSGSDTWSAVTVSTGLAFSGGILTATAATKDAFCANRGGTDLIGFTSTPAKCSFTTEVFDQNSKYDNASNFRWTPAAGLVLINAQIFMTAMTAGSAANVMIYKNGASYRQGSYGPQPDGGTSATTAVTVIDNANGTDYYECWASTNSAAGGTMNGLALLSFFQGTQI